MAKPTCRYVLSPAAPLVAAVYCCKAVTYKVAPDDDENKRRVYETFCPEHKGEDTWDEEGDELTV